VLVDVTFVWMVEMTIMQVIDVAGVTNSGMTATRTVLMSMIGMGWCRASRHGVGSLPFPGYPDIGVVAIKSRMARANVSGASSGR
jgi:hypothetical protein